MRVDVNFLEMEGILFGLFDNHLRKVFEILTGLFQRILKHVKVESFPTLLKTNFQMFHFLNKP